MAEISYPFDAGAGSVISEQQWSNLSAVWQDNGVVADGPWQTLLKVTTLAEPGVIYLEIGEANILGFHYENTTQKALAVPPNNDGANSRVDLVALQLDKNTNAIAVQYKTGVPASSPVPPALVTTGGLYEVALAQITMGPNATTVPNSQPQLIDKRPFVGRRVRVTEDGTALPEGSIFYRQSDGKFYAKNSTASTAIFVGTPAAPPAATGMSVVTSTTRPASPTAGAQIYETDTGRIFVWTGSAWAFLSVAPFAIKRSALSVQTLAYSAGTALGAFTATDYQTTPTGLAFGTMTSTQTALPSLPVASVWTVSASMILNNPVSGQSFYYTLKNANTGVEFGFAGSVGDDTSLGSLSTAVGVTGTISAPAGAQLPITVALTRQGATATSIQVNSLSISVTRIA